MTIIWWAEGGKLRNEIAAWQRRRNKARARFKWMFTTDTARAELGRAYPATVKSQITTMNRLVCSVAAVIFDFSKTSRSEIERLVKAVLSDWLRLSAEG